MGTAPRAENAPATGDAPVRVCPPDWDLTPAEYAALARAEDATWRRWGAAAAGALCAALLVTLAVYADSILLGALGGLCLLVSTWAASSAGHAHRALVDRPGAETVILSGVTPAERGGVDAVLAGLPSRRKAERSLTAYAAREEGLAQLWLLATKIDRAHATGEVLDDAELARLAPPPRVERTRPPSWARQLTAPGGVAAAPGSGSLHHRWTAALARYESVMAEWGAIASDPLAALEHAALLDVTQPRTATFIEALGRAQDRHALLGTTLPADPRDIVEFEELSRAVFSAWHEAERHASHAGYAWLPEDQRTQAERAERLLRVACDQGASPAERATAAEQAAKTLRRIPAVVLPGPALEVVAATARLALGPGPDSAGTPDLFR